MKDVVAVILAGGKGKRMHSVQSKALHRVSDRAIIDWQLDACQLSGIENIIVVVSPHGEDIRNHLSRDGHALNIHFALQEEPRGTADAVMAAMDKIRELKARYVVILVGDLKYQTMVEIPALIIGSLLALAVGLVLQFFVFNVDYTRTEKVQFEDDEYYYYVKAIPKNTVSLADRKVKKIKGQNGTSQASGSDSSKRSASATSKGSRDAQEYRVRRTATTKEREVVRSSHNSTKRIIMPEDVAGSRRERLTEIEKAAAAKARAERKKNNSGTE